MGIGALRGAGEAAAIAGSALAVPVRFLAFGGVQLCLMTFVVTFAVFELGMSLVRAGDAAR